MEAGAYGGRLTVRRRHGFQPHRKRAGNGHRSIGTGAARLPPGQNTPLAVMPACAGSLADGVLTRRRSACALAG